jgi:hypothetical protein
MLDRNGQLLDFRKAGLAEFPIDPMHSVCAVSLLLINIGLLVAVRPVASARSSSLIEYRSRRTLVVHRPISPEGVITSRASAWRASMILAEPGASRMRACTQSDGPFASEVVGAGTRRKIVLVRFRSRWHQTRLLRSTGPTIHDRRYAQ